MKKGGDLLSTDVAADEIPPNRLRYVRLSGIGVFDNLRKAKTSDGPVWKDSLQGRNPRLGLKQVFEVSWCEQHIAIQRL